MEKFFVKYQKFLGTVFALWLFLWIAGKFSLNFGVDLRIFFRILFFMSLIIVFREIKKRKVEIVLFAKSVSIQSQIPAALEQYPTPWSKTIHFPPIVFSFSWRLFKKFFLSRKTILGFCVFGILADIFIFSFSSDLLILILTGLWIYSIQLYKFGSRVSIASALFFFSIMSIFINFR